MASPLVAVFGHLCCYKDLMGQLECLGICSDVAVFGRLCCYWFLVKIQWVSLNAWELICSQVTMFGHLCCMRAVISSGGGDEDELQRLGLLLCLEEEREME